MKVRKSVILGVCGSVIGMILSLIWMNVGSKIWGNVLYGGGIGKHSAIPPTYFSVGFLIASFQCFIAYFLYVITLAKSLPKRLEKNSRVNGLWLTWVGIVTFIINPFLLIPCLMLFTAGSMTLKRNRESGMNI
ncbi:hypothetical protein [Bacillus sp. UNC438CL73TsuS30]|uniref:hypothetical protein n=1 Tax=Bacillus sp. UNC438CL73TsuS30 TaxID=1340434 RepID=UPI00047A3541|nr:hypothetical protein [Bacillus sp. UNC438CL73TsuS30]